MAWVTGIRESRHIDIPVEEYRRGPVMHRRVRRVEPLPNGTVLEVLRRCRSLELPEPTGAGPCGTYARCEWQPRMIDPNKLLGQMLLNAQEMPPMRSLSPMQWSVMFLIEPLQRYFETYQPPLRFGAKPGPRGRKVAE